MSDDGNPSINKLQADREWAGVAASIHSSGPFAKEARRAADEAKAAHEAALAHGNQDGDQS